MHTKNIFLCSTLIILVLLFFVSFSVIAHPNKSHRRYTLPKDLSETHLAKLKEASWDDERIARLQKIYKRYRLRYAFFRIPKPIPIEHILVLAEYANAINGNNISPYLIAAIHQNEVYRGIGIGTCHYAGSDKKQVEIIRDAQKYAFSLIVRDIKRSPRFRKRKINPFVSCVSGEIGYFQIRPTVWWSFRAKVLRALGLRVSSPYEFIPSIFAANFILEFKIKLLNLPSEINLDNSLYFSQVATAYNSGARNAKRNVNSYGIAVHKTALKIRREVLQKKLDFEGS